MNETSKQKITKTMWSGEPHHLPKEVHLPDWARRGNQVTKGRSCRIVTSLTELINLLHIVEVSELAVVVMEVKLHSFLTLVLQGGVRSALRNGRFVPGECTPPLPIE